MCEISNWSFVLIHVQYTPYPPPLSLWLSQFIHAYLFAMTFSASVLGEEDASQHQVDATGYNKLEISAEVEDTEQR